MAASRAGGGFRGTEGARTKERRRRAHVVGKRGVGCGLPCSISVVLWKPSSIKPNQQACAVALMLPSRVAVAHAVFSAQQSTGIEGGPPKWVTLARAFRVAVCSLHRPTYTSCSGSTATSMTCNHASARLRDLSLLPYLSHSHLAHALPKERKTTRRPLKQPSVPPLAMGRQGERGGAKQLPLACVARDAVASAQRPQQRDGLLSKGTYLSPPPCGKVACRHVNAQVLQSLCAQVAVVRPLRRGAGVVALRVGLDARYRQSHYLAKVLADVVLCHDILARELQDPGQALPLARIEIFGGHVCQGSMSARNVTAAVS